MKSAGYAGILASAAIVLQGCGGGGGGSATAPPPPAPTTYSIGGTVTGLIGSVTLQDNAGDSLTVSSNGAFTFPARISAGGAYAVTISSQPLVPDCTVTNGSGTAAANVTNVQVTCVVSAATRYLPVLTSSTDSGGASTGLRAVLSKRIEAPLRTITTDAMAMLSFIPELALAADATVSGARPASVFYQTTAGIAGNRLYAVDLAGSSDLLPRQVSNLVVAGLARPDPNPAICAVNQYYKQLQDPRSAFFVISLTAGPSGSCTIEGTRQVVISSQDSATTSPRDVSAPQGNLEALYHADGALAGLVAVDIDTQTLTFYTDETFRVARALVPNVGSYEVIRESGHSDLHRMTGKVSRLVLNVYFFGGGGATYLIDDAGVATLVFRSDSLANALLSGNTLAVFETDPSTSPATSTSTLFKLDQSAAPRQLTRYQPDSSCAVDLPYDFRGDTLILWRQCQPVPDQHVNVQFMAQTLSTASAPRVIASIDGVPEYHFLTGESLVLTTVSPFGQDPLTATYASEIVDFNGVALQLRQSQAAYPMLMPDPSGDLIQFRNATGPGFGGAGVFHVGMSRGIPAATTRMTLAGGGDFTLPPASLFAFLQTTVPGVGAISYEAPDGRKTVLYDLDRNLVVPLAIPGNNLWLVDIDSY